MRMALRFTPRLLRCGCFLCTSFMSVLKPLSMVSLSLLLLAVAMALAPMTNAVLNSKHISVICHMLIVLLEKNSNALINTKFFDLGH